MAASGIVRISGRRPLLAGFLIISQERGPGTAPNVTFDKLRGLVFEWPLWQPTQVRPFGCLNTVSNHRYFQDVFADELCDARLKYE